MKTRCLIVDDEPLAVEVIKAHIEKIDALEVVSTCANALQAFSALSNHKIDLLFLDIQMPGIKGTDFLKNLKHAPKTILTTAYREYALEGYELDVIDYLLKPISFERFFKSVIKYMQSTPDELFHPSDQPKQEGGYIYLRSNKKIHKILLDEILYIESVKDYVTIHIHDRKIIAKHTLVSLEQKLSDSHFIRIHRSFIIPLNKITGFTSHSIDIGMKELPIGRNYSQQVFKALNFIQSID